MTDHGTLSGAVEFYKECKAQGVKPIIGIETHVAARKHTDKDPNKDKQRYHLILWAPMRAGWVQLNEAVYRSQPARYDSLSARGP